MSKYYKKKPKRNLVLKKFSPEQYLDLLIDCSTNPEYRNNIYTLAKKNKIISENLGYCTNQGWIFNFTSNTKKSAYKMLRIRTEQIL